MKQVSRRELTLRRAAIIAVVLAAIPTIDEASEVYAFRAYIADYCATLPTFSDPAPGVTCPYDAPSPLLDAVKFGAFIYVVYFLIIFGALMIGRFLWRAFIKG